MPLAVGMDGNRPLCACINHNETYLWLSAVTVREQLNTKGCLALVGRSFPASGRATCTVMEKNIIERAFEVAVTSDTMDEIRATLRREGYTQVDAHLSGPRIRADLNRLMKPKA